MPAPEYGYKFLDRELNRRRQPTEVVVSEDVVPSEAPLQTPVESAQSSSPSRPFGEPLLWDEAGNEVEPVSQNRQTELFRPEETFETNIEDMFPQVRQAIENYNRREGIPRGARTYAISDRNRRIADRNRELYAADQARQDLQRQIRLQEAFRGSGPPSVDVDQRQSLIDFPYTENIGGGLEQEVIGGVFGPLADDILELNEQRKVFNTGLAVKQVEDLIKKYPELESMLRNPVENKGVVAQRIDPKSFEKYKQYTDLEQKYSDPDVRAGIYQDILDTTLNKLDLGDTEYQDVRDILKDAEILYTSGNPSLQKEAREVIRSFGVDLDAYEKPAFQTNKPIIGGGGYVLPEESEDFKYIKQRASDLSDAVGGLDYSTSKALEEAFPGLNSSSFYDDTERSYFGPTAFIRDSTFDPDDPATRVSISRGYSSPDTILEDFQSLPRTTEVSRNVLKFLRDNPGLGSQSISFRTAAPGEDNLDFDAKDLPDDVKTAVMRFVRDASMTDRRGGTILKNSPISSEDLIQEAYDKGLDETTSSYIRQAKPFLDAGVDPPSLRGKAYTLSGFGPPTERRGQYTFIDNEGDAVPLQLTKPEQALVGRVRFVGDEVVGKPAVPYKSQPRFYSTLVPGMTPDAINNLDLSGLAKNVRKVPASLAPGAADLIPSAESVRIGYEQGPAAMGQNMANEFLQGIPVSAAAVPILAGPAAPLAPGIGAGLVGSALVEAGDEIVRQETGEGIVPKFRQFIGTEKRTGVADKLTPTTFSLVTPEITATQQRSPIERITDGIRFRADLAGERFNPRRGEFGLSELIFGR